MSRRDWYGYIYRCLKKYPKALAAEGTKQSELALKSITEALEETAQLQYGSDRIKFIRAVYIVRSQTIDAAAEKSFTSRRTAQRWANEFIYLCAIKMGFYNPKK